MPHEFLVSSGSRLLSRVLLSLPVVALVACGQHEQPPNPIAMCAPRC